MTMYRFKKGRTYETKLGHRAEVLSIGKNKILVKCDWIENEFYVCVHIDRDGNEFALVGELWGNIVRLEAKNEVRV